MHSALPMSGNHGTSGTRKERSMSGAVRRRTMTPMLTIRKANSVPMLTSLAISVSGTKAAMTATSRPNVAVMSAGVWRGLSLPTHLGTRPSRLMANMIRVWP